MQQFTNWTDALMGSLAGAASMFLAAIPRLIGFAVILVAGWIIAALIEKAVVALLRAVHLNGLAERAGLAGFIEKSHIKNDPAGVIGLVVKWFVRLIALVVAFDALGLPAVSDVLRQLLMWLPSLVVALVVLVLGGIAATALGNIVRGAAAEGGLDRPDMLAKVARYAVWAFAIMVAITQVGIATSLINIMLTAIAGGVALALGLSFGLGGRDTAATIVRKWYEQAQGRMPQIRSAGDIAAHQMDMLRRDAAATERRSLLSDRRTRSESAMK